MVAAVASGTSATFDLLPFVSSTQGRLQDWALGSSLLISVCPLSRLLWTKGEKGGGFLG